MIRQNTEAKNEGGHIVLKIRPVKFKELLSAFELINNPDSITIFTRIADMMVKERIIYQEKSALEIAFEEFQSNESCS